MQIEWLILLLPLAAASGWFAASRAARKESAKSEREANPVYFQGLNYLLNEEPDKAIDVFLEMLEVDADTIETHLALGNLFRRRGEVERAIRIHQNLIARPALLREQRAQAVLELAQDYMRSGLYDRAEQLLLELKQGRQYVVPVLRNLVKIYQQEKDWDACLKTIEALDIESGETHDLQKSHYFCEMANKARADGDNEVARIYLKRALNVYKGCVRATHLLARIDIQENKRKDALVKLLDAAERAPEYLPEIIREIVDIYRSEGDMRGVRTFLEDQVKRHPNQGTELFLAEIIRQQSGDAEATRFLGEYIAKNPSMPGLIRLVELQCTMPSMGNDHLLYNVRAHLHRLMAERINYQCQKCGFEAKQLHWQCPSCDSWSTIKRRSLIEADNQIKTVKEVL
jgi:lipopolysaccharide biosynthesis regulator YciM